LVREPVEEGWTMTDTQAKIERRKHQRFRVQEGAFVILRPSDTGAGRLVNISLSGLMFEYVCTKEPSVEATELELFVTDSVFRLYGVPCKKVWDLPVYKHPTMLLQKRQSGVEFGELLPYQRSQLEDFIQNHTSDFNG
jgi:hypothetical protein